MPADDALFKPVYDAFARDSTPTLLMRIVTERAFSAGALDALFERTAVRQRQQEILFSSMVGLMVLLVTGARSSVHRAWQRDKDSIGTSVRALYDKLAGVEPRVDSALVHHVGARCAELIDALNVRRVPGAVRRALPVKIVDGMHIASTQRRIKALRDVAAGPRPGFALAVYDARRRLVTDAIFEPDAHAQERSRSDDVLALVQQGECWIADRNFCTQKLVSGMLARGAHPLIREHGNFPYEALGPREAAGETSAGRVWRQRIRVREPAEDGERRWELWRVSLDLYEPTRDGEREIHLITDLPDYGVTAVRCVEAYRSRWTIEGCFLQMATALHAEVDTLGYPPAALFALAVGFCAFNVLSTLEASVGAAQGEAVEAQLSTFALVEEARGAWHGLTVLIAAELWARYHEMPVVALAQELRELGKRLSLDDGYRKSKRGPKKPPTPRTRFKGEPHVATYRILNGDAEEAAQS